MTSSSQQVNTQYPNRATQRRNSAPVRVSASAAGGALSPSLLQSIQSLQIPWARIIAIGLVIMILSGAVIIYIEQERELKRLNEVFAANEIKLAQCIEEGQRIEEKKSMLGSDEYIERFAREELGLVRPDEIIFVD